MTERAILRRRTVNDVEIFLRVLKNSPMRQHNAIMKAIFEKMSNGAAVVCEAVFRTETNVAAASSPHLSKKAVTDLLEMVTGQNNKMMGPVALHCLIAAVSNGYIDEPAPLIDLIEQSTANNQPGMIPKDMFALLINLLKVHPDPTMFRISAWLPILLSYCVDKSDDVGKVAIETFAFVVGNRPTSCDYGLLLEKDLKTIISEMVRLAKSKHAIQMLALWSHLVTLLDKALRNGTSLLNTVLPVMEFGFKCDDEQVRIATLGSWRVLIENFCREKDLMCERRHLKLMLHPLLNGSTGSEELATEKVKVWWFLMRQFGSNLEKHFSEVVVPFLRFCVGGEYQVISGKPNGEPTVLETPKGNKSASIAARSPGSPKSPILYFYETEGVLMGPESFPSYASIQGHIGEIILNILYGKEKILESPSFEPLNRSCCSLATTFENHAALLIQCLEIWTQLKGKVTEQIKKVLSDCWVAIFKGLVAAKHELPSNRLDFLSNLVFGQMQQFIENKALDPSVPLIVWQSYDKVMVDVSEPIALTNPVVSVWLSSARGETGKSTPPRDILSTAFEAQSKSGNGDDHGGIVVPHHSPASTPSAGILKRRRHLFAKQIEGNEDQAKESPLSNQRRVHFCDSELAYLSDDDGEQSRQSPRKRYRSGQGPVVVGTRQANSPSEQSFLNRFQTRTIRMVQQVANNIPVAASSGSSEADAAPASPSPQHFVPDNQKPIYPSLIDCTETIETVLNQLVVPLKLRAMSMFFKGRKITTIGRLASLTEYQALQLPIKTPKLETIRSALQEFDSSSAAKEGATNESGESLVISDTGATFVSPARPVEQAQQPQLEQTERDGSKADEGTKTGNEKSLSLMDVIATVTRPVEKQHELDGQLERADSTNDTSLEPTVASNTSAVSVGSEADQSASPIIIVSPVSQCREHAVGIHDINRSFSPIVLFENVTPSKSVSSNVSMDSPVLVSKDAVSQTRKQDPRELLSELLVSLSSGTVVEMSDQDRRKMSKDLVACLNIVI